MFSNVYSGSEPSLFFSDNLFSLRVEPGLDDIQHDFPRMTDEDDSSVVLAELKVALFREFKSQRLNPYGRPFFCSPGLVLECVNTSLMVSPHT